MKVHWLIPSAHELKAGVILNGNMLVNHKQSLYAGTPYSVVRDTKHGFNLVRVDWDAEDLLLPAEERAAIMDNMRLLAEIKIEQMKEHNEPTL